MSHQLDLFNEFEPIIEEKLNELKNKPIVKKLPFALLALKRLSLFFLECELVACNNVNSSKEYQWTRPHEHLWYKYIIGGDEDIFDTGTDWYRLIKAIADIYKVDTNVLIAFNYAVFIRSQCVGTTGGKRSYDEIITKVKSDLKIDWLT